MSGSTFPYNVQYTRLPEPPLSAFTEEGRTYLNQLLKILNNSFADIQRLEQRIKILEDAS